MKTFRLKNKELWDFANLTIFWFIACILLSCGEDSDRGNSQTVLPPATIRNSNEKPDIIVIFTDDHGYADLGIQGIFTDVKTPNIDRLALNGVQFFQGYVTAPQCTPSRAAMVTGMYQHRFGIEDNSHTPIPSSTKTLGNRFKALGYKTALVGKWHLGVSRLSVNWGSLNFPSIQPFDSAKVSEIDKYPYLPSHMGYDNVYSGVKDRYLSNITLDGDDVDLKYVVNRDYRLDVVNDVSVNFIEKNWQSPFYLHVAHYGPHVPLEAPDIYLSQFPDDMHTRRRYALAMLSAIDKGVGSIIDVLNAKNILDNTMIFFISDNGAPLGGHNRCTHKRY